MDSSSQIVPVCAQKFPHRSTSQVAYLHDAVTDSAVLPLPQEHQTDHNHSCYGHRDHQQADERAAPEAEVLSQGAVGLLTGENR